MQILSSMSLMLTLITLLPYTFMNSAEGLISNGNGEGTISCTVMGHKVDKASIHFFALGEFEEPFSLKGGFQTFDSDFNNSGILIFIDNASSPNHYNLLYSIDEATECSRPDSVTNIAVISGECGNQTDINFRTELMEGNFTGEVNCFE
jgi:hypothetical protein